MKSYKVMDLHIHTNYSFIDDSVEELLKKAQEAGIDFISFTDHNTVAAYEEIKAKNLGQLYSGTIIPGIEIRFSYKRKVFDMLGYDFDIEKMKEALTLIKRDRHIVQTYIFNELKKNSLKLGLKINPNIELERGQWANDTITEALFSEEENIEKLNGLGINAGDYNTFYREHITNSNSPFYVDPTPTCPTIDEVSNAIRVSGGKAFFAHPYGYGSSDGIIELTSELQQTGLIDGVEVMHKDQSTTDIISIIDHCTESGLLVSAGSDYHKVDTELGTAGLGQRKNLFEIPALIAEEWLDTTVPFAKQGLIIGGKQVVTESIQR